MGERRTGQKRRKEKKGNKRLRLKERWTKRERGGCKEGIQSKINNSDKIGRTKGEGAKRGME